jgi:hypothetical protein
MPRLSFAECFHDSFLCQSPILCRQFSRCLLEETRDDANFGFIRVQIDMFDSLLASALASATGEDNESEDGSEDMSASFDEEWIESQMQIRREARRVADAEYLRTPPNNNH